MHADRQRSVHQLHDNQSRLNFLELLNAGDTTHLVNDAAIAYMREHNLSGKVIALLAGHATRRFADRAAWSVHLGALGITALVVLKARFATMCIPIRCA